MSSSASSRLARAGKRATCVLMLLVATAAHAGSESWPQFWQRRADDSTRAVLDDAFRQFTAREAQPDAQLYRRAAAQLRQLLERDNAAAGDEAARLDAGRAWMFLGSLYAGLRDYGECLTAERKGLALIESALHAPDLELARTFSSVGNTLWVLGRPEQAIAPMEQGLRMLDLIPGVQAAETDRRLRLLATVYTARGMYSQALPLLTRRLAIIEGTPGFDARSVAACLSDLAAVHDALNDNEQALALYQRSVEIRSRTDGTPTLELATTQNRLAGLYKEMGDYDRALISYRDSLAIRERLLEPDHQDIAVSLNNLALLYQDTGRYAQALPLLERSISILTKQTGERSASVARAQNALAALYNYLGQFDRAVTLVQRSLETREKVFGAASSEVAASLNNLAALYNNMHRYADALSLYQRSLAIHESSSAVPGAAVASTLSSIAALYANMGRDADAQPLLERSLRIWEKAVGIDHPQAAVTLCDLAAVQLRRGEYSRALSQALRAERVAVQSGAADVAWRAQSILSELYANREQPAAAIFWGKQAVNTLQGLRAGLVQLDEDLQRSFLDDKHDAYSHLAALLVAAGRIPEAQRVMQMLKEEEYFDLVRGDSAADPRQTQVPLTGVERVAHERYYAIRDALASLGKEQEGLQAKRRAEGLTPADQARLTALQGDMVKAREAFNAFVGGLSKLLASDAASAQTVLALQQQIQTHQTLLNTLGDAKDGVATLQYVVSAERLHIILTSTSIQLAREVTIDRKALNARIVAFRETLQNPGLDPREIGRQMHTLLIDPVRKDLEAQGIHTLMLFLDGALRYVPFAALVQADDSYLIERYRLSVQTDAARTALAQPSVQDWQVAAFGVTRPFPERHFTALTAVKGEIEGIVRDDVLPGRIYLDERFTREAFTDALYHSVLHIGSHFRFLPGSSASFLLLGDGNVLTLGDIVALGLRFDAVDLLTLSACETAVGGGIDENGLEVEGLGALAQKQGAKSVLATLWPVADDSTGLLMQQFYRLKRGRQLGKSEALRQAQLQMIHGAGDHHAASERGEVTRGAVRSGSAGERKAYRQIAAAPYAHPYFWAPFVLMGNWR